MARQNTGSLIGRAFMIVLAIFIALVAVSLVIALVKVLAGLLFVVGVIVGAAYIYRKLRG
ncbi:hypothetical protein [Aggregatilinea lenta]|uniref:hypothetical protein n=1 Tax=Aggregatilinea lenta TaxID=913108 RepID=UPI000E5A2683|nr:hypothetical protein [Aggregatilinea lenta]